MAIFVVLAKFDAQFTIWNAIQMEKELTPAPLRVIHVWAPIRDTPNSTARMVKIQFFTGSGHA